MKYTSTETTAFMCDDQIYQLTSRNEQTIMSIRVSEYKAERPTLNIIGHFGDNFYRSDDPTISVKAAGRFLQSEYPTAFHSPAKDPLNAADDNQNVPKKHWIMHRARHKPIWEPPEAIHIIYDYEYDTNANHRYMITTISPTYPARRCNHKSKMQILLTYFLKSTIFTNFQNG